MLFFLPQICQNLTKKIANLLNICYLKIQTLFFLVFVKKQYFSEQSYGLFRSQSHLKRYDIPSWHNSWVLMRISRTPQILLIEKIHNRQRPFHSHYSLYIWYICNASRWYPFRHPPININECCPGDTKYCVSTWRTNWASTLFLYRTNVY